MFKIWSLGLFEPDMSILNADFVSTSRQERQRVLSSGWEYTTGETTLREMMIRHLVGLGFGTQYVDMRAPSHHASSENLSYVDGVWGWHRDDGGEPFTMFTWSNRAGTEIRDPDYYRIYQGRPFEIVAWDNSHYMHRTPEGRDPLRWFMRGRVNGPLFGYRPPTWRDSTH